MKKRLWTTIFSAICSVSFMLGCGLNFSMETHANNRAKAETAKPIDIYLIAGGSNAAGYSVYDNTLGGETFTNVGYGGETDKLVGGNASSSYLSYNEFAWDLSKGYGYTNACIGPEYGMGKQLSAEAVYTESAPAFIFKSAAGGTFLTNGLTDKNELFGNWQSPSMWEEGFLPVNHPNFVNKNSEDENITNENIADKDITGVQYQNFINSFTTVYNELKANNYTPRIKGMAWVQGELELYIHEDYEPLLKTFIEDVRASLSDITKENLNEMPFVMSKIPFSTLGYKNRFAMEFSNMQERIANTMEGVEVVETSDMVLVNADGSYVNGKDSLHYTAADMVTLGQRLGDKLLEMNEEASMGTVTNNTWTNAGAVYTFEDNISEHRTTDIRDLGLNDLLYTAEGVRGHNVAFGVTKYSEDRCMIYDTDAKWLRESSGVEFKFNTNDAWHQPAYKDGAGVVHPHTNRGRISVYYGDLWLEMNLGDWTNPVLALYAHTYNEEGKEVQSDGTLVPDGVNDSTGLTRASYYSADCFRTEAVAEAPNGRLCYLSDWVTVKITKTACTAINGDSSKAVGYWLKVSFGVEGGEMLDAFNTYVPNDMYNENRNDFGIANETIGSAVNFDSIIIEEGFLDHKNFLTIATCKTEGIATATIGEETWIDAGDTDDSSQGFDPANKDLTDKFVMWIRDYPHARYSEVYDFIPEGTEGSVGLEARAKVESGFTNSNGVYWGFMTLQAGSSYLVLNYNADTQKMSILPYSMSGSGRYFPQTDFNWEYDPYAEYAWRITRTPVAFEGESDPLGIKSKYGCGAIVRLYRGKINPETHMPEDGWDDEPIFEAYDPGPRKGAEAQYNGLQIYAADCDGEAPNLRITLSSNKYVGVRTIIDEEKTVNRIYRGDSYTLEKLDDAMTYFFGWSKGARHYEEEDIIRPAQTPLLLENLHVSATYTALGLKITADEAASLRFRKKVDGTTEVALQWQATVVDVGNVGYYFGGLELGYKLYADNGKSREMQVISYRENFLKSYTYTIVQSGIPEGSYDRMFTFQAYVSFGNATYDLVAGQKFYSVQINRGNGGRSVRMVATAAVNDCRKTPTIDGIWEYTNEIKLANGGTGYHYLTQEQYNLLTVIKQ